MATTKCFRQGDVLLIRTKKKAITAQYKQVPLDQGRAVLALGESSMHRHVIRAPGVCMLAREGVGDRVVTLDVESLLETEGGEMAPGVPRHPAIPVPPGTYRVVVQRSWSGQQVAPVGD
jgi:hypothetical protein